MARPKKKAVQPSRYKPTAAQIVIAALQPKKDIIDSSPVPMPNTEGLGKGIFEMVESTFQSLEDGKFDISDITNHLDFKAYQDIVSALGKDRPELVKELAQSSNESYRLAIKNIKDSFDIKDVKDEEDIENFLVAILSAIRFFSRKKMAAMEKA